MRLTKGVSAFCGTVVLCLAAGFTLTPESPAVAQTPYHTCGCDASGGGYCIDYLYTECSEDADCAVKCRRT